MGISRAEHDQTTNIVIKENSEGGAFSRKEEKVGFYSLILLFWKKAKAFSIFPMGIFIAGSAPRYYSHRDEQFSQTRENLCTMTIFG